MISKTLAVSAFALAGTLALGAPASAEMVKMKATLNTASEVPPTAGSGAGTADVTFDTASKKVSWKLNYTGLSGPATMAHFHGPGEVGKNAGVAVPIPDPKSGTEGSATLTDAQAADLLAGKYYINVHTDTNKGGEIRGMVTK